MTRRRIDQSDLRAKRISAIGIVLDAQSIQRPGEEEFCIRATEVAAMSGIPLSWVRFVGANHFAMIRVPGRVVGYDRGEFYVADDEATSRRREERKQLSRNGTVAPFPPLDQMIDPLARADTIGNIGVGYWDGETFIPEGV